MMLVLGSSSSISTSLTSRANLHHNQSLSSKLANHVKKSSFAMRRRAGEVVAVKAVASSSSASMADSNKKGILDITFEPFEEVKEVLLSIPNMPHQSLARQNYTNICEDALNAQINVEYNVSYVYHALYAYFDRDNVALK
ncbi:hypothetical protein PIB30_055136 [Stylosanthes scabra]|uniref:Ferritin n=1 Tax=Stylosanthes scabra TaxID=79078 RepID=A0ABU6ZHT3_9FABA|nr:hypothetical protein [Stylosanthes scabra]